MITGTNNAMEYSINGVNWRTIGGDRLSVSSLIPAAAAQNDVTLMIRFRALGNGVASREATLVLPKRQATPTAAEIKVEYDGIKGSISVVPEKMEYRIGSVGPFIPVGTATSLDVVAGVAAQTFQIRFSATPPTASASAAMNVRIPNLAAGPNATYNRFTDEITITGSTTGKEFRLDEDDPWDELEGNKITREDLKKLGVVGRAVVHIRTAATATTPASNSRIVHVPAPPPDAPDGLKFDVYHELITGVSNLMEYSTNGTVWRAIVTNSLNVSSLIPSATGSIDFNTLRIRFMATDLDAASVSEIIQLPKRQDTPNGAVVRYSGTDEAIINVNDSMEYRIGNIINFSPVVGTPTSIPATAGNVAQVFQVRVKATATTPASVALSIRVPAVSAAPNAVYDSSVDAITITGADTTERQFRKVGDPAWTNFTGTTITRTDIGTDERIVVQIRTAATDTTPPSNFRAVTVPARPGDAPSGLTFDAITETVSNVTNLMEYSTNGTTWIPIHGNPLDVSGLIPSATARDGVILRIRTSAVGDVGASRQTPVPLPKRQATPRAADVRFDGLEEEITGITVFMEVREGTTASFSSLLPPGESLPIDVDNVIKTFQVRVKATAEAPASTVLSIRVPARAAAPNALYNSSTDTITGVTTAREFSLDGEINWIRCTGTSIPRRGNSGFGDVPTVHVRTAATATTPASNSIAVSVPVAPNTAPTGIGFDVNTETVTGVTDLMEYSTNGTTWTPIQGDSGSLDVSSLIPSATTRDVTLRIRVRAAGLVTASEQTLITLPRRQPTPRAADVRFDGFSETITEVKDTMEYRVGNTASYTSIAPGTTALPVNVDMPLHTYQIRLKAENGVPASAALNVRVPARAAAPTGAAYNSSSDTITGVTAAREFRRNDETEWTRCPGSSIPRSAFGDAATTVHIRTAPTAAAPASISMPVSVPAAPDEFPTHLTLISDLINEVITGVTPDMEYSINGTAWFAITGDTLNVSSLIPSATARNDVTLRIRLKAVGVEAASQQWSTVLPKRQQTPRAADVKFDGETEKIIGVSVNMEFRPNNTATYSSIELDTRLPEEVDNVSQVFQIRMKATPQAPASAALNVRVPARAAAPNAVYNGSLDAITGVSTAREYSFSLGGHYTRCTGTTIQRNDFGASATTVYVRTAATATTPHSIAREIKVPEAPASFTHDLKFDIDKEIVTGVTTAMEYSINGISWTEIRQNGSLNVSSLIPSATARSDVTLLIRMRATTEGGTTVAASTPFDDIQLPRRQPTPTTAEVRFDGVKEKIEITGILTGNLEVRTSNTASFTSLPVPGIPESVTNAAQTFQVRVKATATAPASAALNVRVPARAAAPNAVYNSVTNTITGVSMAREYSTDGGITWQGCMGTTILGEAFTGAATVHVRTAATSSTPASHPRIVYTPGTALVRFEVDINENPPVYAIVGVTTTMEYRTSNTATFTSIMITDIPLPVDVRATSQTYQIRVAETATAPASAIRNVTVPARAAAPSVAYNGSLDAITGLTTAREYILDGGTTWTKFAGPGTTLPIPRDAGGNAYTTVLVRTAATATTPESNYRTITVPASRAPAPTIDIILP
jgi:hypothetical protein